MIEIKNAVSSGLVQQLRSSTRASHAALEDRLDTLEHVHDREWTIRLLERFYGFHSVWEPAIAGSQCSDFAAQRSRLSLLETDLESLGRKQTDLARLDRCERASELVATRAGTVGSLYVVEGSTLGGQIISRALRRARWAPPTGLLYFNPYGKRTAERWRDFINWADQQLDAAEYESAIAAARDTFALLAQWLPGDTSEGVAE